MAAQKHYKKANPQKRVSIFVRDVNAAVNYPIRLQVSLPQLMLTALLVFCLTSDLVPNPDKTKIHLFKQLSLNFVQRFKGEGRLHPIGSKAPSYKL